MTPDLTTLIERLEKTTGPDRELDAEIWWALDEAASERAFWRSATGLPRKMDHSKPMPDGLGRVGVMAYAPKLTASLDAAIALAERVLPGVYLKLDCSSKGSAVDLLDEAEDELAWTEWKAGRPPALAFCLAILCALQAQQGDQP